MHSLFRCAGVSLLCLGLVLSAGCGGAAFTGTIASPGVSGSGPTPNPGQAQITFVSPSSMTAGSASFTLTATGVNFTPTTTLMWDSAPLATTYISSTSMRAQVPASLIAVPGTASIVPSPIETFNYGESFTVTGAVPTGNPSFTVSNLAVQANDMVWSQANSLLYLAVSSSDPNRPNSITSLDPKTGRFGSSIATNGSPTKLSVSSDGSYLYASLNSSSVISRYTLPALQSDIDIPLSIGPGQSYSASDLQVEPTNSRAVVVADRLSGQRGGPRGRCGVR